MHLESIAIANYKNILQCELDFVPKVNCILGNNGEGKTNLLDAIYYLSFCKGYINTVDSQNINHDHDLAFISGEYARKESKEKIYSGLQRKRPKQFKRNKKKYSKLSDHIGLLPLVMVSPIDSKLVLEGSEERRRYMDGVISQFDKKYLETLIAYNKVLTQRNIYLKQGFSSQFDIELVGVWNDQLQVLGSVIYEKRSTFVQEIIPVFQKYYSFISGNKEEVKLEYNTHMADGHYERQLSGSMQKDLALGYTSRGIHRDDLVFALDGLPIKRLGSQGQQKTFLTALKFAQFEFIAKQGDVVPILLLDDIFDKLDALRVEKIVELVSGEDFGQIFITDTNREHLYDILERIGKAYRVFFVEQGEFTQR